MTPPAGVMADVWLLADGDLGSLASAARLAVTDFRDLRLAADVVRRRVWRVARVACTGVPIRRAEPGSCREV